MLSSTSTTRKTTRSFQALTKAWKNTHIKTTFGWFFLQKNRRIWDIFVLFRRFRRRRRDSPPALRQCRRQPWALKNHSPDGFSPPQAPAAPFSPLLLLLPRKKAPYGAFFRGGEGGIRTLAPVTPAYSLSRGAPYSHLGTSPRSVLYM